METTKQLVYLVTVFALAVMLAGSVSAAFASVNDLEVNGVDVTDTTSIASFAGSYLPVKLVFTANENASDAVVYMWIAGHRSETEVKSNEFEIVQGSTYTEFLSVPVPSKIDPTESLRLEVMIETADKGTVFNMPVEVKLAAQRQSYVVEILDVNMDTKVKAGDSLMMDVVLKNRGKKLAEDTFVRAVIPALGIETRAYFGDLTVVDQADPDKEDAAERTLTLRIPAGTPAGVYAVEIEAFNDDSVSTMTKRVAIVGAGEDSQVIPSVTSKSFAVGEKATYLLTLVNSGTKIRVYELVSDAPTGLTVNAEESVIAVPAGSSRTVKLEVSASKAGEYDFTVNTHSNGALVSTQKFSAKAGGTGIVGTTGTNATLVLTVVLAIIFVVLLVVLIVLLTRKPKKEEFGESYY